MKQFYTMMHGRKNIKVHENSHTFLESLTLRKTLLLNVGNQLPVDKVSHQNTWTIVNTAVRSSNLATTLMGCPVQESVYKE